MKANGIQWYVVRALALAVGFVLKGGWLLFISNTNNMKNIKAGDEMKYTPHLETNKIYHGDCLELMPQVASGSIDMILCDLPYGTTACKWDSIIDLQKLWFEYKRVIKKTER